MNCAATKAAALIAAAPADGQDGPSGSTLVRALADSGLLAQADHLAHHPTNPEDLLDALRRVGGASLAAGRLFEGHINAVKLLTLHGIATDASLPHGIWGADGADPVRVDAGTLCGQKMFASGAGILRRVIVTARDAGHIRLFLVDSALLQGRLFPGEWNVSGMKDTASGRCDLHGLAICDMVEVGPPDTYLQEPHFHGGTWRYAAVWLGAMQTLTKVTADHLTARGQHDAPLQAMRLHRMISACETAYLWLRQAAHAVERPDATPRDAETAILARLRVAIEAAAVITDADQALGAASFSTLHPADRIRRDLSFYLRQANPDGLAMAATGRILADPALRARWLP